MKKKRPTEIFPSRLRSTREKRALNQSELARRAGLQASAVSQFETGTRKPSFDNLRRLADALDVTTDYLIGRVDDNQASAGQDQLYRNIDNLTAEDREFAESFIKLLAKKSQNRRQ